MSVGSLDGRPPVPPPAVPWIVLLVQAVFALAVYGPTLQLGLLADAWVLVEQAEQGPGAALTQLMGWHYIPLMSVTNALAWPILGANASGYQAVTIALQVVLAHLTFRLGLALFGDVALSLVASLLFLGTAASYELTFWPAVGHAPLLGAVPFLLGLRTAIRMAGGGGGRGARLRLAGWFGAAVLTYTGMVTLLPLAAIVLALGRFRGLAGAPPRPWRDPGEWRSVAGDLLPSAAVLVVPVVARTLLFPAEMAAATYFRFDWFRVYTLDRALGAVLSLRGSPAALNGLVTLGTGVRGGPWLKVLVWGWLLLALAVLARATWRSRTLASPLLLSWLLLQLGLTALSIPVASRHTHLSALPAALLSAAALRQAGLFLASRWRGGRFLALAPMVLGGLALLAGAWFDLQRALDAGRQATDLVRRGASEISAALANRPGPVTLTLVDLPSMAYRGDIGAYAFTNGTDSMVRLVSGRGDVAVDLRRTPERSANVANGSRPLDASERRALAADPARIVLVFDPQTGDLRPPRVE